MTRRTVWWIFSTVVLVATVIAWWPNQSGVVLRWTLIVMGAATCVALAHLAVVELVDHHERRAAMWRHPTAQVPVEDRPEWGQL